MKSGLLLPNIPMPLGVKTQFYPPPANSVLYLPGYPPLGATIRDFSGQGNHGTISGATWTRLSSGLWCLSFDGTDDEVGFGNILALTDLTIELWEYHTSDKYQYILSKAQGTGYERNYLVHKLDTNVVRFTRCNGVDDVYNLDTTVVASINTWNYIVITEISKAVSIYINAGTPKTGSYALTVTSTQNPLTIGFCAGDDTLTRHFIGNIGLCRIYNRALSPAEITSHYNQERHLFGV